MFDVHEKFIYPDFKTDPMCLKVIHQTKLMHSYIIMVNVCICLHVSNSTTKKKRQQARKLAENCTPIYDILVYI